MSAISSAAEAAPGGRYDCQLSSQGTCRGDGPGAFCLGAKIRLGPPTVYLTLDFDRNEANLNGIRGIIYQDADSGSASIVWNDLAMLGSPAITVQQREQNVRVSLRSGDNTADFYCRRSMASGRPPAH